MFGLSYEGGILCKSNTSETHLKSSYRRHNADVMMVNIQLFIFARCYKVNGKAS